MTWNHPWQPSSVSPETPSVHCHFPASPGVTILLKTHFSNYSLFHHMAHVLAYCVAWSPSVSDKENCRNETLEPISDVLDRRTWEKKKKKLLQWIWLFSYFESHQNAGKQCFWHWSLLWFQNPPYFFKFGKYAWDWTWTFSSKDSTSLATERSPNHLSQVSAVLRLDKTILDTCQHLPTQYP